MRRLRLKAAIAIYIFIMLKNELKSCFWKKRENQKYPCLIVAEISANHGGNLEFALKTLNAIKKAGAGAVMRDLK